MVVSCVLVCRSRETAVACLVWVPSTTWQWRMVLFPLWMLRSEAACALWTGKTMFEEGNAYKVSKSAL